MEYFVFDKQMGIFERCETEEEAKKAAEAFLEDYKDRASTDGWPEEDMTGVVGWGRLVVVEELQETERHSRKDYTDEEWEDEGFSSAFDEIVNYELKEVK